MGKASTSHDGNFVHIILEMVEDGQRLEFDVGPGTERKKVRFEIGHVQGYGELFVERFEPLNEGDELDLRVKLIVPAGSGDRPAATTPAIVPNRPIGELVGTNRHVGQLIDKQRLEAMKLPKADDGAAFNTEPVDAMEAIAKEEALPADATTEAPGAPTPQEIMGMTSIRSEEAPALPGTTLEVLSASRQFVAPDAKEEAELQKVATTSAVASELPAPTAEELAERADTTPPKLNEERELEAKNRRRRDGGFGGKLR